MHKKIIGILVCMLLFSIAVLPATSKPILESENISPLNRRLPPALRKGWFPTGTLMRAAEQSLVIL